MSNQFPSVHVFGLGAMANALIKSGRTTISWSGWDPSEDAQRLWKSNGGRVAEAVPKDTQFVLSLLPSVDALRSTAAKLLEQPRAGLIWAEASTLPVSEKVSLRDQLIGSGVTMLDTPFSGTAEATAQGDAVCFVGGQEAGAMEVLPICDLFCKKVVYVGEFENASAIKIVAQHLVAVHTAAAAEAFGLLHRLGVDLHTALHALEGAAPDSVMLQARGRRMADRYYSPAAGALAIIAKDLDILDDIAAKVDADLPLLWSIADRYRAAARRDPSLDLAVIFEDLRKPD